MTEHSHGTTDFSEHKRVLGLVLALSSVVLLAELLGAVLSGSLALLADAGHVFTDMAGLIIALVGATLMTRPETAKRTWGYRRIEILAAALQSMLLLGVGVYVIVEATRRLFEPEHVNPTLMIWFGLVGLLANSAAIVLLIRIEKGNLNTKAAMLEVINDALGSVAVVIAGLIIAATGWNYADAVVSLLIGGLILPRSWKLLRETLHILMESAPKDINLEDLRAHILKLDGVVEVHDLHASLIGTDLPIVTAHVTANMELFTDGRVPLLLTEIRKCLSGHFDLEHSTIQIEPVGFRVQEHRTHD